MNNNNKNITHISMSKEGLYNILENCKKDDTVYKNTFNINISELRGLLDKIDNISKTNMNKHIFTDMIRILNNLLINNKSYKSNRLLLNKLNKLKKEWCYLTSIEKKYLSIKNIYDKVKKNHDKLKQAPEYLLVVMIKDDMSYLSSSILRKSEEDNDDIHYFNMFNLDFNTIFDYGVSISLNELKQDFNLLLFDFNLDFDKFADNYINIRSIINEKYECDHIILDDYKISVSGLYLCVYKKISSDNYYEKIKIYNTNNNDFNKEFFNAIIDFNCENYQKNRLVITNGKMNINLLDGGSGDIGYICDDNFKVDFIGIKNDDMIHANSQTCFISDKHFITINKFDNNLRTKIKNGICLNKYEKQELNRLLSLYNNMGYNIKV